MRCGSAPPTEVEENEEGHGNSPSRGLALLVKSEQGGERGGREQRGGTLRVRVLLGGSELVRRVNLPRHRRAKVVVVHLARLIVNVHEASLDLRERLDLVLE